MRVTNQIMYDDGVDGRKAALGISSEHKATSIRILVAFIAVIRCFVKLIIHFNSLKWQIHDCGNSCACRITIQVLNSAG